MFVTSHITFGQPSKFVGGSLEVIRTIRNNKLHFTWGCFILLLKKKKEEGPETGLLFFLFQWLWYFLKYFNSNHNLPSYSLFSKCFLRFFYPFPDLNSNHNLFSYSLFSKRFSWFFHLGVLRGTCVFLWLFLFFTLPLARDPLSPTPRAYLRLTEKGWKIAPVLQIQASSMKLIVHGFLFLGFLHIKTDGKNKLFF